MDINVKKYLDKVVDQMVSETEVLEDLFDEVRVFIMTPFYDSVFTSTRFIEMQRELQTMKFFPIGKLSHNFSLHVKNIYGLSKEEVPYTLKKYVDTILLKIERNKNTITESEKITVKDSISLMKIIKYLKDKTKVVIEPFDIYDGYIIAPIGNGFRWDFEDKTIQPHADFANEWWKEMQGVYGLSSKEVLIVMGIYQDFIWETLEKISDGRY